VENNIFSDNNRLKKVKLLGISFSQIQPGAYALVLTEEQGNRRIPIIIGTPEAQSIAIFLEGMNPPRPLSHDLFVNILNKLEVKVRTVVIYKYEDGVFYSNLYIEQPDGITFTVDSRTSDAIAIGIRTASAIYIDESVMEEVSVTTDDDITLWEDTKTNQSDKSHKKTYDTMSAQELSEALDEAVRLEDYEKASYLRDLINNKLEE
jgi:Uncharacterized conserved protein